MSSASETDAQWAFEDLYVTFYRHACRTLTNVQQHSADDLYWIVTGFPHPMANAVIRTHWDGERMETLDQRIATTLAPFQARGAPMMWYLWPTSSPEELGDHLVTSGFVADHASPMMSFDLSAAPPSAPAAARIERVNDQQSFARWVTVVIDGFGFPESARALATGLFMALGYSDPFYQYLAWLGDEPAAAASLVLDDTNAGIFNVATLPAMRGKGIGSAITAHALHEAHAAGRHSALLVASEMGEPVYRRLGFQTCGMVREYVWQPQPTAE